MRSKRFSNYKNRKYNKSKKRYQRGGSNGGRTANNSNNIRACGLVVPIYDSCPICLKKFNNDKVFLQCGHSFHKGCIDQWYNLNRNCPLCKKENLYNHEKSLLHNSDLTFKCVKHLLDNGADPNIEARNGITPLLIASEKGKLNIVKELLDRGVDPNKETTDDGTTPLFMACAAGNLNIVKELIARGADPNKATTDIDATPIYISSYFGHLGVVRELLAMGADPNKATVATANRETPLYAASNEGYLDVVKELLAQGADPNIVDYEGRTPLYIASLRGLLQVVKLLLEYDVDPNITTNDGISVLKAVSTINTQSAEKKKIYREIMKHLVFSGAKIILPPTYVNMSDNIRRIVRYQEQHNV